MTDEEKANLIRQTLIELVHTLEDFIASGLLSYEAEQTYDLRFKTICAREILEKE